MKRIFALSCLWLSLSTAAWAQSTHYYETKHQDTGALAERSLIRFEPRPDGTTAVHFEKGYPDYSRQEDYVFGADGDTLAAHIVDEAAQTDFTLERRGTSALFAGTFNGKALERRIELGKEPLFLFPKFNLAGFVLSDKKRIDFWGMRNDTLEEYKMIATREGVENIIINNEPTYAAKIYLTTANPLFRVFKRTYYFRLNDGLFLKQEYPDGRVREWVREE